MTGRPKPLLPDVGVIALVPDRFGDAWQPRHQVMSRLSRFFHVVWLEPARPWREIVGRVEQKGEVAGLGREPPEGLSVCDPGIFLPMVHRPAVLREVLERMRLRWAARQLRSAGCRKRILYLWRPEFSGALSRLRHDVSCYHIDDEYSFSDTEGHMGERELRLLESVDQVFIHSPALLEKKGWVNPRTSFVPNGVDYRAFASPAAEPSDLARIAHPRIGYVGFLKPQVDWDLILALALRHPSWSFVFIGPRGRHGELGTAFDRLTALSNAHFLGGKTLREVAAYPQHLDVCILPYSESTYTSYINPLKLYEYLAAGRPTVGVPIRSLQAFADVVCLAKGVDEWSLALESVLSPKERSAARIADRQAVAQTYDWDRIAKRIVLDLADCLGPEARAALERGITASPSDRQEPWARPRNWVPGCKTPPLPRST